MFSQGEMRGVAAVVWCGAVQPVLHTSDLAATAAAAATRAAARGSITLYCIIDS